MWFAGMLINFRPSKSGTPAWPVLAKVMPKFSVKTAVDMSPNTLALYTVQAKMIFMSENMVDRYLEHATSEMLREKRKEIRCPCQKCKQRYLLSPFSSALKEHG